MVVAALIISVLALLVSAAAVWYTRKQANVENERRRDEIAPRWHAEFTRKGSRPRVVLTNQGPSNALSVLVELVAHPPRVRGLVDGSTDAAMSATLGDVPIGVSIDVLVGIDQQQGKGGEIRLLVRSQDEAGRASAQLVVCNFRTPVVY
jgi:hypothetical protein